MAICNNCGIEYDSEMTTCPLCHGSSNKNTTTSPADILDITRRENKQQLWELAMVLLFSAMIITLAIDAVFGKGIRWSLITSASFLYLGAILSIFHLFRRYLIISSLLMASTVVFLFFIGLLTDKTEWFLPLALPLTCSFFILLALSLFLNSLSRYRGLNLVATIFIALALFSIVAEICIDYYLSESIKLQWSVVTAAALTILSLILIFIHYRLKRGDSLQRMFHI